MTYGNALCVAMRLTDRLTHAPEAKGQNPIPSALEIAGPGPMSEASAGADPKSEDGEPGRTRTCG